MGGSPIKSVAIIGAGAAGAVAAAAFMAERCFSNIRIFERRESPGGTWYENTKYLPAPLALHIITGSTVRIYDPDPSPGLKLCPGSLPPEIDPPLKIPDGFPRPTSLCSQERFNRTPIYEDLATNVPDIAMSFSDRRFAYGPFTPHWVPRQYITNYFSVHRTDSLLVLSTTVEDVSKLPTPRGKDRWKLTLRRFEPVRHVDVWWEEEFDAVILANGHYSVPYVPQVKGLDEYIRLFPNRIMHSKSYCDPLAYQNKRVLIIGNSASGQDITTALVQSARLPVYQSRKSPSRWDGDNPLPGIEWKPIVKEYLPTGEVIFDDGSILSQIDTVIYCTGYKASFPFWNTCANDAAIWDYSQDRLVGSYWHTFFRDFPTLGAIGVPRVLTFRSFEYQAIALARVFAGRNAVPLPPPEAQERWERERWRRVSQEKRKFHDIPWDDGETMEWLRGLFEIAGLPQLEGRGRCPPVLGDETRWAIEHVKKYPEPERQEEDERDWVVVDRGLGRDSLHFI